VVDHTWQAVAALVDPVRRGLYEHVRRERRPVTREDAAQALDISRNLAAFHLDKLVEVGLLSARYESPEDQPRGRGRTPKVYLARDEGLSLTLPERRYDLVGTILADAIAADPADARRSAHHCAGALGREIGAAASGHTQPRTARGQTDAAVAVLTDLGYEPERAGAEHAGAEQGGADHAGAESAGAEVVLDNCPFDALASRHTELICGINVAFVGGLLSGLGCDALRAELRPRPGGCCVCVHDRERSP
jgi:predicted ArsR family transcriptional regulator